MKPTQKSSFGTSFYGYTITATYKQLVKAIGEPQYAQNNGEDKSNFDWILETEDGTVFTVYDWKEYRSIKPNETIEWHIGANTAEDSRQVFFELEAIL
jgi:hypothetical protein